MYAKGMGVPRDLLRTYMWFKLSASLESGESSKNASQNLDAMKKVLTSEQMAQAEEMDKACLISKYKNCD